MGALLLAAAAAAAAAASSPLDAFAAPPSAASPAAAAAAAAASPASARKIGHLLDLVFGLLKWGGCASRNGAARCRRAAAMVDRPCSSTRPCRRAAHGGVAFRLARADRSARASDALPFVVPYLGGLKRAAQMMPMRFATSSAS